MTGNRTLEEGVRLLWGAYAYLRDNDLATVSGTSRLLHVGDIDYLCSRLACELDELAGVLEGTHYHTGQREDVLLEGSQVCYWVYLVALSLGLAYEQASPLAHLTSAAIGDRTEIRSRLPEQLRWLAGRELAGGGPAAERISAAENLLPALQKALELVALACKVLGVTVRELVAADLEQMQLRPYMRAYFCACSGKG